VFSCKRFTPLMGAGLRNAAISAVESLIGETMNEIQGRIVSAR
jgi:hypothetical protein